MPMIWKQALAVAIGVSGQAYLGILHPPATSLSGAFAKNSSLSWGTMESVFIVDAVVVSMSMLILNLSENKQYPLFWMGVSYQELSRAVGRGVTGEKTSMVNRFSAHLRQHSSMKGVVSKFASDINDT